MARRAEFAQLSIYRLPRHTQRIYAIEKHTHAKPF